MKLFLHEITEHEKQLNFTETTDWIANAVSSVDERSEEQAPALDTPSCTRPIQIHVTYHRVEELFIVSGKILTCLQLFCSRCASAFPQPCQFQFSTLFSQDPIMAGVAHLGHDPTQGTSSHQSPVRPIGQNQGFARHAHDQDDEDLLPNHTPLDILHLTEEFIDLRILLIEQLQLQIPLQPLCKETCRGICFQCGVDFNQGDCTCHLQNSALHPFSVLKDFKVK